MGDKIGVNQEAVLIAFANLLLALEASKPNDRSSKDRYYAITTTEVEKAAAIFRVYACEPE
jgi:hypothetical protein